jgi:hypothetical protein
MMMMLVGVSQTTSKRELAASVTQLLKGVESTEQFPRIIAKVGLVIFADESVG